MRVIPDVGNDAQILLTISNYLKDPRAMTELPARPEFLAEIFPVDLN